MIKKNKKGFEWLSEETLKIVVAVVCVGLLIYALASLVSVKSKNNEIELAKASLQKLISDLDSGFSESQVYNPTSWYLTSWPSSKGLPTICSKWASCLCFCQESTLNSCNENAICSESSFSVSGGSIKIAAPLPITLTIKNKVISKV